MKGKGSWKNYVKMIGGELGEAQIWVHKDGVKAFKYHGYKIYRPNPNLLTKREKDVASAINPYYKGFATKEEVAKAKAKARGKFWEERGNYSFVSFTKSGRRKEFMYCHLPKDSHNCCEGDYQDTKQLAKQWAKRK